MVHSIPKLSAVAYVNPSVVECHKSTRIVTAGGRRKMVSSGGILKTGLINTCSFNGLSPFYLPSPTKPNAASIGVMCCGGRVMCCIELDGKEKNFAASKLSALKASRCKRSKKLLQKKAI
jgi:hypothetical protein